MTIKLGPGHEPLRGHGADRRGRPRPRTARCCGRRRATRAGAGTAAATITTSLRRGGRRHARGGRDRPAGLRAGGAVRPRRDAGRLGQADAPVRRLPRRGDGRARPRPAVDDVPANGAARGPVALGGEPRDRLRGDRRRAAARRARPRTPRWPRRPRPRGRHRRRASAAAPTSSTWAPPRAAPCSSAPCPSRRPPRGARRRHRRLEEEGRMSVPLEFTGTGGQRIVDLSMPVHADMMTFPRVPPPMLLRQRDARGVRGADRHQGVRLDRRTAHYVVDPGRPRRHALRRAQAHRPRRRRAGDDPARLLLRRRRAARLHRRSSRATGSPPPRSRPSSTASGTSVKPRDIVLIHTGAGAYNGEERYKTDHPGMTAEADALADRARRADDGHRRDHVRPAGVGDVRAQAVLGGAPGHVGRGVLAPREPDEPRADRPAARLQALRAAGQVGRRRRRAPVRAIAIVED